MTSETTLPAATTAMVPAGANNTAHQPMRRPLAARIDPIWQALFDPQYFATMKQISIAILASRPSGILGHAHDALASAPQSVTITARACGRERWNVKTLTDAAASQVNFTPIPSTVDAPRALLVPGLIEFATPRPPQETRVYAIPARLLWDKLETDSDFHVVIAGQSGATMIAEFPDPGCAAGSRVSGTFMRVRQEFVSRFGEPSAERFQRVRGAPTVQLTGVLFFDILHDQRGVAPNGVELHPVLNLSP